MSSAAPSAAQSSASDQTPAGQGPLTELPLEELLKVKVDKVYAASRFEQEVTQAPASISIITGEEIRAHGYRTLADVMRSVRGFYVTYDRNYSYAGARGFSRPGDYNDRLLLLLNGHRLNDTIFEEALLGTESPIDVALIDRVEVIRGPSSSLYGTSAFFGVVNIITRSGRSIRGLEIDGQGGSQGMRSTRATLGGRTSGGAEGLISVSAYGSRGNRRLYYPEFDTPADNHGVARGADADGSFGIFSSAAARGVELQMGYGSRVKTVPTASFGTVFNDPRTRTRDARGFVDLQFTHLVRPRTTLQARASYDQYDYDGTYVYDEGLFQDAAHGAWITTELTLVQRHDRHTLTSGLEHRNNIRQDQQATDWSGPRLDDRRRTQTLAAFVEDEVRLSHRVRLSAGLRWDEYFATFGGTLNPRLGVILSPSEGSTLKVLYGRAFRAPNPYELYYDQNTQSASLQPERIATHEAVWSQRVGSRLQLTGSIFHNRVSDLITQRSGSDTLDGLYYQNAGGATATGVELEVEGELPGRIHARISDSFQTAADETSHRISNSPRQIASLVVDAPLRRSGLVIGFNAHYVGERRNVRNVAVPGAVVSDVTVSAPRALERLGFAVTIRNLFDVSYADPGSEDHRQELIPQDGRTVTVRATWRF